MKSQGLADEGGVQQGPWTTWYENGKKESLIVYTNGVEEGPATTWHDNGRKASEGRYAQGHETDAWRWWSPEGKVERMEKFPAVSEGGKGS
jgi:antitoxin component YwqK of YwqJK toxin-antitoxin module